MRPVPAPLRSWLDALRCPQCGSPLAEHEGALACAAGHSFDLARAGYVSLLRGGGAISGDDDEMARARERFLDTGAYDPLRTALADLAARTVPALAAPGGHLPSVLDMGCGPGHYLATVLDRFPAARGLGVDTSARSLRFAARAHDRAAAVRGDVFAPFPLADSSVDLLLDVFAPRNAAEFARVLRPDGALLVARPAADHLAELRALVPGMVAVDPLKEERLHAALDPHLHELEREEVRIPLALTGPAARDLVAMTPSARHVDPAAATAALGDEGTLEVTVSVLLSAHRPR
jgi:23S rRNA (guanine745-N1)-methyltransferase